MAITLKSYKDDGCRCPKCESEPSNDWVGDDDYFDWNIVRSFECSVCNTHWKETYTLRSIEIVKD